MRFATSSCLWKCSLGETETFLNFSRDKAVTAIDKKTRHEILRQTTCRKHSALNHTVGTGQIQVFTSVVV